MKLPLLLLQLLMKMKLMMQLQLMRFDAFFGFESVVAKKAEKRRVDFEMALRQMRHQLSATIQRKRLGTKVTRGHLLKTLTTIENRTEQASAIDRKEMVTESI